MKPILKTRMTRMILFLLLLAGFQTTDAQDIVLKTNGLYWMTTTPNAALEAALGPKVTLELAAAYNPWTFKDDKKMRFWLAQPASADGIALRTIRTTHHTQQQRTANAAQTHHTRTTEPRGPQGPLAGSLLKKHARQAGMTTNDVPGL